MAQKTVNRKVVKVVEYFAEKLIGYGVHVSKIVVFGSHIQGAAGEWSDIDLIVVSESFRNRNLFERANLIGKAYSDTVEKYLIPMDIIMETPEEYNPDFGVVVFAA